MGRKKNARKKPPPPPLEPAVFNIENFGIIETHDDSLSIRPTVITPKPGQTLADLAAEEETTCGTLRMHIEKNSQGKPEYQFTYLKQGDPDPKLQEDCEEEKRERANIPKGQKRLPLPYELNEHGLPDVKATTWMKEPLTFPVLNESIDFRKILTAGEISTLDENNSMSPPSNKKRQVDTTSRSLTLQSGQTDRKKSKMKFTGHKDSLDKWSSTPMLKEFFIYPVMKNFIPSSDPVSKDSPFNGGDLGINVDDFIQQPFYATDNLTGKEIHVDPTRDKMDDNGYYTVYDPLSGDNFIIEPPMIVALDPITGKELVIDPRKPVGQYYSVEDATEKPIVLDTTEQQPYIYKDPVTGASLLIDEKKTKPYTVKDPRTGVEVRINPLKMDGKPYVFVDSEGGFHSIQPIIPGGTPILFDHPTSGEATILGGPILIRNPETGDMQYQEGAFTMRNPKTGQNINQVGPIMKTNPISGEVTLMSNPGYIKHPQTGELMLEPSLVYKIQNDGKIIPTMPKSEQEKAKAFMKNKDMLWDEKLGVFVERAYQSQGFNEKRNNMDGKIEDRLTEKLSNNEVTKSRNPSMDSLLERMIKPDRKRVKNFIQIQIHEQREFIRTLMSKKKDIERNFMHDLLIKKEKVQTLFIQSLMQHFGTRLKYYDKAMFSGQVRERVRVENEALTKEVEEKIKSENNRALDAILIELEKQKIKLLEECNMKGTVQEFSIGCKSYVQEFCDHRTEPDHDNHHYKRTIGIFKNMKSTIMTLFDEALHRENELIRREICLSLQKEMDFIEKKIEELYVKICCQKFLIVN